MAVDVIMPQMGESIFEGTITKWLKKPGDKIERDEPLFEISTDKVDAEIPSPAAGVLKEIKVNEGQTVPIQTVVAVIDAAGASGGRSCSRAGESGSSEGRCAGCQRKPKHPKPAPAGSTAASATARPHAAPAPPQKTLPTATRFAARRWFAASPARNNIDLSQVPARAQAAA